MPDFTLWLLTETIIKLAMITMIGLYFIFSNTIMYALSSIDNGADVMVLINKKILNPLFLGCFFISGVGSLSLFFISSGVTSAAGIIFFIGTVAVTVVFNVPLNDKLKGAQKSEIKAVWKEYLSKWVVWNHVRTVSGVTSGLLLCM
ncbi:DUF1772 domain-containing protein [Glaciecola sp. KUL10]|uniref:anthrone oxygenase family protein n=1 Tax=Glaciecola sp. (strain KUL10) TaxID=2161813 RepID=UPI000D7879C5|nr:anthrone oxygenase family protein [Glaciecola sp. KUL10]GBL05278.1 hypothetical protein KUL10_25980 [Glaciecola sp. KUL10]